MKTTDLMIGDWVKSLKEDHSGEYGQVIDISHHDTVLLEYQCVNYYADVEHIEPIPLTPEILEKSRIKTDSYLEQQLGFKNSHWYVVEDDYGMHKYTQDPVFHFGRLDDTFDGLQSLTLCNIRSVHELQHALRLCGIEKELII